MLKTLPLAVLLAACGSYNLPSPSGFQGEQIAVRRHYDTMTLDGWQITGITRTNAARTRESMVGSAIAQRGQNYRFVAHNGTRSATVLCMYEAGGSLFLPRRTNFISEEESLRCNIAGDNGWLLDIANDADARLSGRLEAPDNFNVQAFAAPNAPVSGFYLKQNGETVATVQLEGKPAAAIARGLPEKQRAAIMPAIAALLLLDERLREI